MYFLSFIFLVLFFVAYYADLPRLRAETIRQEDKTQNFNNRDFDLFDIPLYRGKGSSGRNSHGHEPPYHRPSQNHGNDDHGTDHKSCTGKLCEDNKGSPNEQKEVSLQCSKYTCTSRNDQRVNRECKSKTGNKCSYCVSRRCSRTPGRSNGNGKKEDNKPEETKEVSRVKYNRFTPVNRRYPYKGGRSRETRRPFFNKCVLRGIDICRECRRRSRTKRQEPKCDQCDTVLRRPPFKNCAHYYRNADFWKRRIIEDDSDLYGYKKLIVKDSSDNEAGYLTYKEIEDKKERPLFVISFVEAFSQGNGIGRALMEHFVEKIVIKRYHFGPRNRKKKAKEIKLALWKGEKNEFAYPLYQKLGFALDEGHCESDECPRMTLDLRNYKTGDKNWKMPPLDECVWNEKKMECNVQ